MTNVFQMFGPESGTSLTGDAAAKMAETVATAQAELEASAETGRILSTSMSQQSRKIAETHAARAHVSAQKAKDLAERIRDSQAAGTLSRQFAEYLTDAAERAVLTADALRQRGDIFLEHEAAGCPPVLIYDYDVVMDGADLPFPSNYMLLKIRPPEGVTIDDSKRPYIVIDPRAGHGPGIGGFKTDSQIGVAMREGHPAYFVAFRREPEPGQYISHVTRAEAAFVREVMRRHPDSSAPVVIGNCQGGWATLLLAASNPDLTGPIVINGAPVAPWAGRVGENPMRYNAGVSGGTWVPMLLSDLGGGIFDGAHLVQNFEQLNPGRTKFRKYTDLFRDADTGVSRFLEFETWWGGFFLLNEPEIRWIVEQLFVGNRLVKNEARIEPGRPIDIKEIRAPMIVFASHGDNITPPQQALNWIVETYADANEIRIRGQRIIYMVHEQVGHLGIFVSSSIANREHSEMASTMKTIEALAPGLYEMKIEDIKEKDGKTHFTVGFGERTLDDIRALDDNLEDERPFAAVARASEVQAQLYEAFLRPAIRAAVTPSMAEATRTLHPQRLSRALASSRNPAMAVYEGAAERVRSDRHKASPDNPFLAAEALWVEGVHQAIDFWRDWRDMMQEMTFFNMWSNPWARRFGRSHETHRTLKDFDELRSLPEVTSALMRISQGGFAEAVIRMLILMADNRGTVRRDRLERSSRVLTRDEPFKSLGSDQRARIIHEQTLVTTYEPERAIETLPDLLPDPEERKLALQVARFVPGRIDEMSDATQALLERFRSVLGLDPITTDILADPLAQEMGASEESGADNPPSAAAKDTQTDDPDTESPASEPAARRKPRSPRKAG